MDQLFEKYDQKRNRVQLYTQKALLSGIDWSDRFIGIKGARGASKTTLLFQYILESNKHKIPLWLFGFLY